MPLGRVILVRLCGSAVDIAACPNLSTHADQSLAREAVMQGQSGPRPLMPSLPKCRCGRETGSLVRLLALSQGPAIPQLLLAMHRKRLTSKQVDKIFAANFPLPTHLTVVVVDDGDMLLLLLLFKSWQEFFSIRPSTRQI